MVVRFWTVGMALLGAMACSMDVDVSGLAFASKDAVSEPDWGGFGPIECPKYVHCLLGEQDAPGEVEACLAAVSSGSLDQAEALELCRERRCGALPQPGDAAAASAMVQCLFRECTAATVECVAGHGESTCLSYAVKWQSQVAGTTQCSQSPADICLLDYLSSVRASERVPVVGLIQCIVELPLGAVEQLPKCLSLCD